MYIFICVGIIIDSRYFFNECVVNFFSLNHKHKQKNI